MKIMEESNLPAMTLGDGGRSLDCWAELECEAQVNDQTAQRLDALEKAQREVALHTEVSRTKPKISFPRQMQRKRKLESKHKLLDSPSSTPVGCMMPASLGQGAGDSQRNQDKSRESFPRTNSQKLSHVFN